MSIEAFYSIQSSSFYINVFLDLLLPGLCLDSRFYSLDLQRQELGVYPTQRKVATKEPESWMAAWAPHLEPTLASHFHR
jgi:hypothetical protein